MSEAIRAKETNLLQQAVARMRAGIMAVVMGMVGGAGMFAATLWLVIRGGEDVGTHLGLLANYFPGYDVTWGGAFLGFFYGGLVGSVLGFCVAWVYNRVADSRNPA